MVNGQRMIIRDIAYNYILCEIQDGIFKTIVSKGTALIYDPYYAFVYLIIMLTLLVKKLLLFKISAI